MEKYFRLFLHTGDINKYKRKDLSSLGTILTIIYAKVSGIFPELFLNLLR